MEIDTPAAEEEDKSTPKDPTAAPEDKKKTEKKGLTKGTITCSEFDNETSLDDLNFEVSTTKSDKDSTAVKSIVKTQGIKALVELLQQFLDALKTHHDIYSEAVKSTVDKTLPVLKGSDGSRASLTSQLPTTKSSSSSSSSSLNTVKVVSRVKFSGPITELFACLTDERRLSAYTQSVAVFEPRVGGAVQLFGGSITGKVVEINPPTLIALKWRVNEWPEGHYSDVRITLEDKGGKTIVSLTHSGVPSDDVDRTTTAWRERFWDRIKMVFGFEYRKVES